MVSGTFPGTANLGPKRNVSRLGGAPNAEFRVGDPGSTTAFRSPCLRGEF